jgi:hypothetical protein
MYECFLKTEKTLLNPKGGCMKKLLVVLMVLSMATLANAGLVISGAPATMGPSDIVILSVVSDGLTSTADTFLLMDDSPQGAAAIDLSSATNAVNSNINGDTVVYAMGDPMNGVFMDMSIPAYPIPNLPAGTVIDQLVLTYDSVVGVGAVTLTLVGADTSTLFDTVVINQIPEPMTMCLLGLGGLFLRRRSK